MLSESTAFEWNQIGANSFVDNEIHEQCAARAQIMSKRCRQPQHFQCIAESRFVDSGSDRHE